MKIRLPGRLLRGPLQPRSQFPLWRAKGESFTALLPDLSILERLGAGQPFEHCLLTLQSQWPEKHFLNSLTLNVPCKYNPFFTASFCSRSVFLDLGNPWESKSLQSLCRREQQ